MNESAAVFKTLLAITSTLAVLLLALFPFQEPGTGSRVVSILALGIQGATIIVASAGLYFGWQPLRFFEEE